MKSTSNEHVCAFSILTGVVDLDQPRQEIAVTLPDGSQRKGISWETSPMDIAKEISKGLADRVVIAKVSHTLLWG